MLASLVRRRPVRRRPAAHGRPTIHGASRHRRLRLAGMIGLPPSPLPIPSASIPSRPPTTHGRSPGPMSRFMPPSLPRHRRPTSGPLSRPRSPRGRRSLSLSRRGRLSLSRRGRLSLSRSPSPRPPRRGWRRGDLMLTRGRAQSSVRIRRRGTRSRSLSRSQSRSRSLSLSPHRSRQTLRPRTRWSSPGGGPCPCPRGNRRQHLSHSRSQSSDRRLCRNRRGHSGRAHLRPSLIGSQRRNRRRRSRPLRRRSPSPRGSPSRRGQSWVSPRRCFPRPGRRPPLPPATHPATWNPPPVRSERRSPATPRWIRWRPKGNRRRAPSTPSHG